MKYFINGLIIFTFVLFTLSVNCYGQIVLNTWGLPNATLTAWNALLKPSATPVEAVIAGCSYCESGICGGSIGAGGSPDETGETTLDAMIMDGSTMRVGSVGCLRNVQNAIGVAHAVMQYTQHTLLVGDLASKFALEMGFLPTDLHSNSSMSQWKDWLLKKCQPNFRQNVYPNPSQNCGPYNPIIEQQMLSSKVDGSSSINEGNHDTIGMIAMDSVGNIAAGTTTNGANHKVPGRVGDSPIVGAGAYAESGVGASVATGDGDVMMRFVPSYDVVQMMRDGMSPGKATMKAIKRIAKFYPSFSGALLAIDAKGTIGAACHGFGAFQYCVASLNTPEVKILQISC